MGVKLILTSLICNVPCGPFENTKYSKLNAFRLLRGTEQDNAKGTQDADQQA